MRRERQRSRLASERARPPKRRVNHGAMTPMHAVEISDREDGAGKRSTLDTESAAAHDVKMFFGLLHHIVAL